MEYPNLSGVIRAEEVEQIDSGSYKASYLNWSRTMQHLREGASGWLPIVHMTASGDMLHDAPKGCYLLIGFRHIDGSETPPVPQAVMDNRNNAILRENITARDITDTHRRGICLAAAMTFGLAYELWAKEKIESGYAQQTAAQQPAPAVDQVNPDKDKATALYAKYFDLAGEEAARELWGECKGSSWAAYIECFNEAILAAERGKQ